MAITRTKLYRADNGALLMGVCKGLANYFQVNAWAVRAAFVLLSLASGLGILLYIALAIFLPKAHAA